MTPLVGFVLAACLLPVISAVWLAARVVAPRLDQQPVLGRLLTGAISVHPRGSAVWLAALTVAGFASGHPVAVVAFLVLAIASLCISRRSSSGLEHDANGRTVERQDAFLCQSWDQAARLGIDIDVVARARSSCSALMRAHQGDPLDLNMLEWVVFLRAQIPLLVRACTDGMQGCNDAEKRLVLVEELGEAFDAVWQETERRLVAGHKARCRNFDFQREYTFVRANRSDFTD